MIAGFPESVQGVYLIQVGRMPTFSLKSEARGLALELVFCATGVAVTSKTDTDGKLYTKSEKIEKEKARSSSDGEVLASSGSKVLFSAIALATRPCKSNSHHLFFSNSIQSTIKVGEVWFSPKLLTRNR